MLELLYSEDISGYPGIVQSTYVVIIDIKRWPALRAYAVGDVQLDIKDRVGLYLYVDVLFILPRFLGRL